MGWWSFIRAVMRREHSLAPTTWVAFVVTVIYTISPLDFIPELFFGPFGLADDLGVWGIFLVLASREKVRWEAANQPQTVHAERLD
jgi:uncharacterized membrane protein YkvA (DUF1232 family)